MFLVVDNWVWARDTIADMLDALSAIPGAVLLNAPKVHLYKVDREPTPDDVPSDYTECAFVGYSAQVLGTLSAVGTLGLELVGVHKEVDFVGGAIVAPGENAFGCWLSDTTGAIFYGASRFPVAQPFAAIGDFLSLDVVLPLALRQSTGQ